MQANQFEKLNTSQTEVLAISIVNVGFHLDFNDYYRHNSISKRLGYREPPKGSDGSLHVKMYAITYFGEPICLNEYAARLAAGPSTHVTFMQDHDSTKGPLV